MGRRGVKFGLRRPRGGGSGSNATSGGVGKRKPCQSRAV